MKRLTGTHVYTFARCPRAVALDLHEDPARRRPPSEVEEFVLRRGRELEARLTAQLGWAQPSYPERDFAAGAAATRALLDAAVPGVLQGVLLEADRLGVPDLLRREPGRSSLGEHHYVVGDIKSSRAARGDQVLQVMFYARLLERLQGRSPEYAFLTLRDGREERLRCADYGAALDEVEQRLAALRDDRTAARPFLGFTCESCRWSDLCLPELEARDDLSLLQGMTRGLREMLEQGGVATCAAARAMSIEAVARRTRLEATLLRRIKRAAQARGERRPLPEPRNGRLEHGDKALVHALADPFLDRVHWFGILYPARADGEVFEVAPADVPSELPAFAALVDRLPAPVQLWHYGEALPRWYEDAVWRAGAANELEVRFVDLARRLRGAATYPGPVFGLRGHVRMVLGLDPHRAGDAGAVGIWVSEGGAAGRLQEKGRSDLRDLAALVERVVEAHGPEP